MGFGLESELLKDLGFGSLRLRLLFPLDDFAYVISGIRRLATSVAMVNFDFANLRGNGQGFLP